MSTLELPKRSKVLIVISLAAIAVAGSQVFAHGGVSAAGVVIAFLLSGFVSDAFTALAHFCFDYVFPETMPILGPVAREFRNHHEYPTLDPSNYVENFTKGAFVSLPASSLTFCLAGTLPSGFMTFTLLATLFGISVWAFFFHQIHSYAHMGSTLSPEELHACISEIRGLPTYAEQLREFSKLFDAVPIPPVIRFLQRARIILNPAAHNFHHILFESDFSSVNGWSDPLLNLVLGPIARRKKALLEAAAKPSEA